MSAITVEDLTKRFGDRLAIEELSFDVAVGEVFGFLGPNGAGKTTTVRILSTLLHPTSGRAEVAGIPVGDATAQALRQRIGVLTESPGLYLKLSVYDNLEYFAGLYGFRRREAKERIARALETVGLTDRSHELAGTLSKGLRQRAALARTLLSEPAVLFLDEPTQGLDPAAAVEVRELIEQMRAREVTVFLTTHHLEEADRVCDRVAILNTRLVALGSPEELRRRLSHRSIEVRLVSPLESPASVFAHVPGIGEWQSQDGRYLIEAPDPEHVIPSLTRALVSAGADVLAIGEVRRSLEQAYLELLEEHHE